MRFICRILTSSTPRFISSVPTFFQFMPRRRLTLYRFLSLYFNTRCQFRYVKIRSNVPYFYYGNRQNENRILCLLRVGIRSFNSSNRFDRILFLTTQVTKSRMEGRLLSRIFLNISTIRCLFGLSRLTRQKLTRGVRGTLTNVFQYGFRSSTGVLLSRFTNVFVNATVCYEIFALVR